MHAYAIIMQYSTHLDKKEVLKQEYSQPPILPSPREYCGLSTASEVFLIFTSHLYSCLEGRIATAILPAPNTPLSSLPVGSKPAVSRPTRPLAVRRAGCDDTLQSGRKDTRDSRGDGDRCLATAASRGHDPMSHDSQRGGESGESSLQQRLYNISIESGYSLFLRVGGSERVICGG